MSGSRLKTYIGRVAKRLCDPFSLSLVCAFTSVFIAVVIYGSVSGKNDVNNAVIEYRTVSEDSVSAPVEVTSVTTPSAVTTAPITTTAAALTSAASSETRTSAVTRVSSAAAVLTKVTTSRASVRVSETTPMTTTAPPAETVTETSSEIVTAPPPTETTTTTETTTAFTQDFPADINTISREGLLLIPNVGEVTADEIIALRGRLGRISDMSRLLEISGIGEARLAALSEYLYVSGGGNSTVYEPPQTNEQAVTQPDASSEEQSLPTAESGSSGEETDSVTDESSGSDDGGMVYINSANAEELAEKLGISPGKAEDIIDVRMRIGGFSAIEELLLVDSLTTNDIAEIKDRIIID